MADFGTHPLLRALEGCPALQTMRDSLPGPGGTFTLGGARGSSGIGAVAALHLALPTRIFVIATESPGEATRVEADLEALLAHGESCVFPQRESLPYETSEPHLEIGGLRVEAIEALFSQRSRILVTTLRALQEQTPLPSHLSGLRLSVVVGDARGPAATAAALEERGFERVPMVEEVGQYAVRGGILDLFSFGASEPVRLEFWGDEIESIRHFDILDQRSIRQVKEAHILPVDFVAGGGGEDTEELRSLLQLLPADTIVVTLGDCDPLSSFRRTWQQVCHLHQDLVDSGASPIPPDHLFLPDEEAWTLIRGFGTIRVLAEPRGEALLDTEEPARIDRKMPRLEAALRRGAALGHEALILCDNDGQVERLEEILADSGQLPPGTRIGVGSIDGGFLLRCSSPPLHVLTDHEIFRRSRRLRRGRRFRGAVALESLAQLKPGDYVVHMDHGIGRFRGLEHIHVAGEELENLVIEYAGEEILRVPVYRIDLIERWVGEGGEGQEPPRVHRIGGKKWKTLRRKTKESIEVITQELVELYARRSQAGGYAFPPDTRWQREMESAFLYEDTPDQRKAAEDVKRDMESAATMDRLVCGDVGYGKTEVAIRAAFKAVQAGKQVAFLAPTTILVEQHRHTLEERLADYPVRIGALSRFRSPKQQKELIEELAHGRVDIIIGTHRLLSPDIRFKDLGLLIVDEEQRFGVRHKEVIKRLRESVDVLTLTATPIPRTLYLSLSGIRDLSIIRTPPRDRMPILTHVLPWTEQVLAEALHRELDRGGQTFFLHNRVETIYTAAEHVKAMAPEATVAVAHGQMPPHQLEDAMRGFVEEEIDILVCSSIIENGLDVPNANTLIVDRADRFGLAQLYQIRGRVGRSDRRAYCYLVVPDPLPEEAKRRLKVLEHYTELGSGYAVAMKDLELRGAGNLLGANQSGFAHAVGLDTYLRMLEAAVGRLKKGKEAPRHSPADVSLVGSAYLPDSYISDSSQKLHLYRRLSRIEDHSEIEGLRVELLDRFGQPPPEVERLLDAAVLRLLGRDLGVQRIFVRDREARISFRPGVVPRMSALKGPLKDRQIEVEVRRMDPLSLGLRQAGTEPLSGTLIRALTVLVSGAEQIA